MRFLEFHSSAKIGAGAPLPDVVAGGSRDSGNLRRTLMTSKDQPRSARVRLTSNAVAQRGPIRKSAPYPLRRASRRCDRSVASRRHLSTANHSANAGEKLLLLLQRIVAPTGDIHVSPSLAHITLHEPRHGCDATIDRTVGLFGMTILTRFFEHRQHCWIDFGSGQQRLIRLRGLQRSVRMDEYGGEKDRTRTAEQEHENDAFQIAT